MKNPISYLKHIVKDPINTIAEANFRQKEILPLFYVSLGVLALGIILQLAANLEFMAAVSFIGLVGVAFCGFLFWVIKKAKERFRGLTCSKCNTLAEIKTPEDFAKYISFTVESDEAIFKGYSGNKEPTDGVYSLVKYAGSSKAVVSVDLTCPHCGEVKHLKYTCKPFECHAEAKKVGALRFQEVASSLETAVRNAVNDYNNHDKKESIPYTYQSTKNPHYEAQPKGRVLGSSEVHIDYMGAKIDFHQDVEEMLEHYFTIPMINGTLKNPSESKKK